MTAIINDNLVTRTLSAGVVFLSLLTGCFGGAITYLVSLNSVSAMKFEQDMGMTTSSTVLVGSVLSAVLGMCVAAILTSALESAVATVFVCFAEDPIAFQKNHYDEFASLLSAWDKIYPDVVSWIFERVDERDRSGVHVRGLRSSGGGAEEAVSSTAYPGAPLSATLPSAEPVGVPISMSPSLPPAFNPAYNPVHTDQQPGLDSYSNPPPFNPQYKR